MARLLELLLIVTATVWPTVHSQECDKKAVLDVVFAVDNTSSMKDLIFRVRAMVPTLIDEFENLYPGSRYGFYSVTDKDDFCNSTRDDVVKGYCTRLELELTSNVASAKSGIAHLRADVSGVTNPEDSLGGLLVASHNANWRPLTGGENILRTIILVTDAGYNQPGHPFLCKGPNFRPNDGDATYDCTNEDYPSVEQVKAVMSSKQILPIFLTVDHQQRAYQTLLDQLGLGGLTKDITNPSTNVFEVVRDAIGSLVCETPTTPAPKTSAPTTLVPKTSAPTTLAPKTSAPTTPAPKTSAPTTPAPKTSAPTTLAPKTSAPTTPAPTTPAPTTLAPTTPAPTTLAPKTSAPTTPAPKTSAPTGLPTTSPGSKSTEAETTTTTAWIPGGGSGIIIIGAATAAAVVVAGVAGGLYLRHYMANANAPAPIIDAQFDDRAHESENRDKEQIGLLDSSAYV